VFVASLIGSPAMNFMRGTLSGSPGSPALHIWDHAFPVNAGSTRDVADVPVLAGIRPEHVRVSADASAGAAGRVELVEPMGLSTLVHLTVAGQAVKALSFERLPLRPGMPVGVGLAPERVHLFDPVSERRIA